MILRTTVPAEPHSEACTNASVHCQQHVPAIICFVFISAKNSDSQHAGVSQAVKAKRVNRRAKHRGRQRDWGLMPTRVYCQGYVVAGEEVIGGKRGENRRGWRRGPVAELQGEERGIRQEHNGALDVADVGIWTSLYKRIRCRWRGSALVLLNLSPFRRLGGTHVLCLLWPCRESHLKKHRDIFGFSTFLCFRFYICSVVKFSNRHQQFNPCVPDLFFFKKIYFLLCLFEGVIKVYFPKSFLLLPSTSSVTDLRLKEPAWLCSCSSARGRTFWSLRFVRSLFSSRINRYGSHWTRLCSNICQQEWKQSDLI